MANARIREDASELLREVRRERSGTAEAEPDTAQVVFLHCRILRRAQNEFNILIDLHTLQSKTIWAGTKLQVCYS